MLDLRLLSNRWTVEGARRVFAELVTQCVRNIYPEAEQIRPNPGDGGIDTFVGRLRSKTIQIWQAKYFPDGLGDSQKKQIRESFKSCVDSQSYGGFASWTLCLPIDLSIEETKWWQGWRRRQQKKYNCSIELWAHSRFVGFSSRPGLNAVFRTALDVSREHASSDAATAAMKTIVPHRLLESLSHSDQYADATFVRKLEQGGVTEHRAARTAFYNFELLRQAVVQGGSGDEHAALRDLLERIYDLWDEKFNGTSLRGRELFAEVQHALVNADQTALGTNLPTHTVHKKGALHYWADICEAGWTDDFRSIGRSIGRSD